jgi:membrane-anchored glycerophosphoryl diester phosphodiesterase (GDPDase)
LQGVGEVNRKYEEDGVVYEAVVKITEETVAETFFHEVMHIILDATGEETLSENERFVNIMGKSLLEIYLSSVYEKESTQ